MKTLREVCESVGITRRQLQGYENAGLVKHSVKNKMGHLLYDEEMFKRICQIYEYKSMGFTLSEIRGIIDSSREVQVKALKERLELLLKEQSDLAEKIKKVKEYME